MRRVRSRRRLVATTVVTAGLAVLVAGCESDPTAAGACFAEEPRRPLHAERADCDDAAFELVAYDRLADDGYVAWPGRIELSTLAYDRCADAVEAYTGVEAVELGHDVWFHHPSETAWAGGDRRFVCAVTSLDGSPLGGSVAAAER